MAKRITVTVILDEDYKRDAARWMKNEMIIAAMERVSASALTVTSIEAKVGSVRATRKS